MTISRSKACDRLSTLGFKQNVVHRLLNTIEKWDKNEGPEATVSRLKQIKTAFIKRMAGQEISVPWVKHTKTHVKGPFKTLFDSLGSRKKTQRALSAMMLYSSELSKEVTSKQRDKFWGSVLEGPPSHPRYEEIKADMLYTLKWVPPKNLGRDKHYRQSQNLSHLVDKRGPSFSGIKNRDWNASSLKFLTHPVLQRAAKWNGIVYVASSCEDESIVGGRIGYMQEPGFKLRAIANPCPIYNYVLTPLKDHLLDMIKRIPEDFTHDQEAGVAKVQEFMRTGESWSSVDLSDATNLFPAEVTFEVLESILEFTWKPQIDAFKLLARSDWYDPLSGKVLNSPWKRGQPLGLGPSFPAFALSHHLVARSAIFIVEKDTSVFDFERPTNAYAMVGDDIVIKSVYAPIYRKLLKVLGCKISKDKSIESNVVAEFCSRVITESDVFVQNKWTKPSDRNFMDLAKNLGTDARLLFPKRQRQVIDLLAELPTPWGLGLNPNGLSLIDRVVKHRDTIRAVSTKDEGILQSRERASYDSLILTTPQPIYDEFGNVWYPKSCKSEPDQGPSVVNDPLRPPKLGDIIRSNHDYLILTDDDLINGYSEIFPEAISDPRGQTMLKILESKLKIRSINQGVSRLLELKPSSKESSMESGSIRFKPMY